ncbi:hypothetical protein ACVWZ8_004223 [Arthrobacter sp. UYCu723]
MNPAGIASLIIGIFATWLFMYGLVPAMQGPIAVALGGWDLSWLAGGVASAGAYALMGPRFHRKFLHSPSAGEATSVSALPRVTDVSATTTAPVGL